MKVLQTIIFVLIGVLCAEAIPVGRGRLPQRSPRLRGAKSIDLASASDSVKIQGPIKHRAVMMRPRTGRHADAATRKATIINVVGDLPKTGVAKRDIPLRRWQRHSQWKKPKLVKKKKTQGEKNQERNAFKKVPGRDKLISEVGLRVVAGSIQQPVFGNLKMTRLETRSDEGIAGFVEVAVPLHDNSLAKNVAGLVYAPTSGDSAAGFEVHMSEKHSTQFVLKKVGTVNDVAQYQLQVPILDSVSLTPILQCITFALDPPAPLSLQKCLKDLPLIPDLLSGLPVVSQLFSYESTSGELRPMRIVNGNDNSTVNATRLAVVVEKGSTSNGATSASPEESPAQDEDDSLATESLVTSATPPSTSSLPTATNAPLNSLNSQVDQDSPSIDDSAASDDTPHVLLFFVPANTLDVASSPLDSTDSSSVSVADTTASTTTALPAPSPMMAEVSLTSCPDASDSLCNAVKTVSVVAIGMQAMVTNTATTTTTSWVTSTPTSW